ncbi:Oxidoreductase-like protein, N-terminal domain containing protein [Naviculisporaceae sp. PSN 640]
MRRNILSAAARPSRALAGLNNYPRRTFTSTIAAKEQVHPIGPFYEAILRSPPFIPETKPEAAPVSSAPEVVAELPERPKPTPTTPAPAPAAEQPKPEATKAEQPAPPKKEEAAPEKPAAAPKSKKAPAAPKEPKEAEPVKETPAKRTRASSKKAKSVAPDCSSPSSSSPPASSLPLSSHSSSVLSPSSSSNAREEQQKSMNPKSNSNDPSQAGSRESNSQSNPSDTPEARARVIFSSSLVGPAERAERLAAIKSQSRLVAGVLVPPKPEEPDNCCMSGCVNCVWERYRDELEDWASASAEAERRLMAREASSSDIEEEGLLEESEGKSAIESVDASMAAADRNGGRGTTEQAIPAVAVSSMDDDGGGSETNWIPPTTTVVGKDTKKKEKEFWNEDLYKNVPVGIREFMKQEKRLKEKHLREGTLGG